jgi:hypothetical protein
MKDSGGVRALSIVEERGINWPRGVVEGEKNDSPP